MEGPVNNKKDYYDYGIQPAFFLLYTLYNPFTHFSIHVIFSRCLQDMYDFYARVEIIASGLTITIIITI